MSTNLPKLAAPPYRGNQNDILKWLGHLHKWLGEATGRSPLLAANITEQLNVATQVSGHLASANQVNNAQLNSTNRCTVDSVDNGTNATIQVYGLAGVGSMWTRIVGSITYGPFPAASLVGYDYATQYLVAYNPTTGGFIVSTSLPDTLPDNFIPCGNVTTVAAGGAGGVTGGGGITGGGRGTYSKYYDIP